MNANDALMEALRPVIEKIATEMAPGDSVTQDVMRRCFKEYGERLCQEIFSSRDEEVFEKIYDRMVGIDSCR